MRRKSLETLKREAQKATSYRGHRMLWDLGVKSGRCIRCGAEVWLDVAPAANSIDISGPAVALDCARPDSTR